MDKSILYTTNWIYFIIIITTILLLYNKEPKDEVLYNIIHCSRIIRCRRT